MSAMKGFGFDSKSHGESLKSLKQEDDGTWYHALLRSLFLSACKGHKRTEEATMEGQGSSG